MNKEILRMQMLAGIITEGQYNEETKPTVIYKGGTEDMPYRREILVNGKSYLSGQTSQEEQQEIANFLGVETEIDEMYEPNQFAEILGYNSVQDLAVAIAEKYGVELTVDLNESSRLYREGDNIFNIIDQQLLIDDIDDEGLGNNYFPDGTSRIPIIKNIRGKKIPDYTDDQKQKFIDYLIKMKDKGNEKAIELYKIAQTNPESKEFI